ncbi:acyltransferase [Haliea sp. E1-2-M8]|uniref:acyltransferase family protein n=1 Tax=Haliea sp. E1-2-M8 TaxID=3064706 RepID=UPI002719E757|nr:acyltransferase [Haliea sp. E1-2-M8]MDO8862501.1 acyltransferase [Haliea sp. E1-2-M8]
MSTTPATGRTNVAPAVDLAEGVRDRSGYLRPLESVRGIAILLVFLFHAWGISGLQLAGAPAPGLSFIVAGNTGVTLFFVLSGFLLALPWLKHLHQRGRPRPSVAQYLKARALRILPLYYSALLLTWLVTGNSATIVQAATFQFVGFDAFPYSVVWWTLATEIQFYLLLPLLMSLWLGDRRSRLLGAALFLGWLYAYVTLVLEADAGAAQQSFLYTKSIFARLPAFLLGIAAAAIYLRACRWQPVVRQLSAWRHGGLLLCLAILLLLERVLARVATLGDQQAELHWHLHHTWEAALWALFILCLLLCRLPGLGLLVNRSLALTGKLSYSLYLVHVPVLFYLLYPIRERLGAEVFPSSWWLYGVVTAALLLSLLLSWISYTIIEKPFLQLKRRIPL